MEDSRDSDDQFRNKTTLLTWADVQGEEASGWEAEHTGGDDMVCFTAGSFCDEHSGTSAQ